MTIGTAWRRSRSPIAQPSVPTCGTRHAAAARRALPDAAVQFAEEPAMSYRRFRWFLFIVVCSLLALGGHAATVAADHLRPAFLPAPPTLSDDSAAAPPRGVFIVAGQHFTPGGRVYLALYDQMG